MATFVIDGVEQPRAEGESVYPKLIFDRPIGIFRIEFDEIEPETAQSWIVNRSSIIARPDGVPAGMWLFLQGYVSPPAEETETGS